jgi:hypothetical protein
VLNYVVKHRDNFTFIYGMKMYGGVDVETHISLTSGKSWRWMVSFTLLPLNTRRNIHRCPLDRSLGGPKSWSGRHEEVKILASTGTRTPTSWLWESTNAWHFLTNIESVISRTLLDANNYLFCSYCTLRIKHISQLVSCLLHTQTEIAGRWREWFTKAKSEKMEGDSK